jgi:imidazolonepropionase-like amidohydrolase
MRPVASCLIGFSFLLTWNAGYADDPPAEGPIVFRNARIYPVSGPPIERGLMVVRHGKIVAIGKEQETPIPKNATVQDLAGKVIIPGLVDTHSHIGIYSRPAVLANSDGNEMTAPAQPGLRALDAIYPGDPGIRMAVAGGITTANIMPGSGNVIGGQTVYVKLRGGTIEGTKPNPCSQ